MTARDEARTPQVLCIAGSPRGARGNSSILLDAFAEGVADAGGRTTRLAVSELAIAGCRACHACSDTGLCVIRDDMDRVFAAIDAADAIAVASPVHFASVPAQLKALYDRCQPYWARRFVLGEPVPDHKRPGALLVVGGGGDPFGSGCVVTPTKSVFGVLGVSLDEVFEVIGPDKPGDVLNDTEALARARAAGAALSR